MPNPPESPSRNRLLAMLPPDAYAALAPSLARVELDIEQVVFDVDRPIEHVFFPESCVVSILSVMADGSAIHAR